VNPLVALLDEAFDHKSWHGTTLLGSVRGLDAATAARRPAPSRHNIWEIVVHAAYWKYAVRRRLSGDRRASFAENGSNWFTRPAVGFGGESAERAFKADVALLKQEHRQLRALVVSLSTAALNNRTGTMTKAHLIRGVAAHDLYHAGQIQLLKKLV
jgi:uncharacterized damage-inducible protein DinB